MLYINVKTGLWVQEWEELGFTAPWPVSLSDSLFPHMFTSNRGSHLSLTAVYYITIVNQSCESHIDTLTFNPSHLSCFSLFTETLLSGTCPAGMDPRPFLHCDACLICGGTSLTQEISDISTFQPLWQMRQNQGWTRRQPSYVVSKLRSTDVEVFEVR